MYFSLDTIIHLLSGGIGGTIGAIVTCPLEVVKTRQQSSLKSFDYYHIPNNTKKQQKNSVAQIFRSVKHIYKNEGKRGLFRGLGPNLVGVAPSRAIYFCTYSQVKTICNENSTNPETPFVHMTAAASAGFVSSTLTNPIWFVKTRLQLDQTLCGQTNAWTCVKSIYKESGLFGFYKGITASYFGISETIIHFVIYEYIKSKLRERIENSKEGLEVNSIHILSQSLIASSSSKACAAIITYPHEVARTRLRQQGTKYRGFVQTLRLVYKEEGRQGLYRGLATHIIKQIPNTAIMMVSYEFFVHIFTQLIS